MSDIIDIAQRELGGEAGGWKYISWYGGFGRGTAWCAIFISWCADRAGALGTAVPRFASVAEGMSWYKGKGLYKAKSGYTPKRGDIIFFKNGMSHVGLVVSSDGQRVHTIEGNSTNRVEKNSYSLSYNGISGYGLPRYPASSGLGGGYSYSGGSAQSDKKDVTRQRMVYTTGGKPEPRRDEVKAAPAADSPAYELLIQHEDSIQYPVTLDGATLSRERNGAPAKLEFTVLKTEGLNFQEGDAVSLRVNGINAFLGYVFTKNRNKDGMIKVTAYDQLRYLKNKDTVICTGVRADELLTAMANDYGLTLGALDNTGWTLARILEDGKAAIDIIEDALDETLYATGKMFVLYDDYGELRLTDSESMIVDVLIDSAAAENFDYSSSIDKETYNRIRLAYDNGETGERELYEACDAGSITKWGVLQNYIKLDSADTAEALAEGYLKLYNRKSRSLSISGVTGDIRVRGGSRVYVTLDLGDISANSLLMVESVSHRFSGGGHRMDLDLRGWEFGS